MPTDDAAPTAATFYYVSAVLHYQVDGMSLAIPFAAADDHRRAQPQPDAPLLRAGRRLRPRPHPAAGEPSQPFALGVQVVNTGAGTADNVSITSAQPEIVGSMAAASWPASSSMATQVDGQNLTPSLTVDFGSIAPGGARRRALPDDFVDRGPVRQLQRDASRTRAAWARRSSRSSTASRSTT